MSVKAGSILHLAGNNVIDRIQSAGLGDVNIPVDTIREVGNDLVVDQVTQDPDFNFTMSVLDVSTDTMAWLCGALGNAASAQAPGASDPDGTEYLWSNTSRCLNVVSPWKDPTQASSAGVIVAGHIVPLYYPTQITYRFGVTDDATQEVQLSGGSYYYGKFPPVEEYASGDGASTDFASTHPAIHLREGGSGGGTFRAFYGVVVDGVLQIADVDYTESGGAHDGVGSTATLSFTKAPKAGADIRYCYFTSTPQSLPQATHASVIVKPGAVRGRNICVLLTDSRQKMAGVQSVELTATREGNVDREFCNTDPIGFNETGINCTGSVTVRSKDYAAFFETLRQITGVNVDEEVVGWLNDNPIPMRIQIQNPKNPAQIIKTLRVDDAKFQVPGTPAQVNSPTDFNITWQSVSGDFAEIKGTD